MSGLLARDLKSSMISRAEYDPESRVLRLTFAKVGQVYRYEDVPEDVVNGLCEAESIGTFFAQNIRGKYPTAKVTP
ncbi:MAG: KTSC domain-containing protein [Fimbriimonadaceae bacterium]|nr:KTSC domain-containing protein [Fimbriimonadaceae bacterium]